MSGSDTGRSVQSIVEQKLDELACALESLLDSDVIAVNGPIYPGMDSLVRSRLNHGRKKRDSLALVLTTPGGVIETVERIVQAIRAHYNELIVIVPDAAMSAGTVLSLAADRIMMDDFSCLGPIDPQIERNGKLVPALSYLIQLDRLCAKENLTTAEIALLQQLDLAELHKFEEARELSVSLLKEWLTRYKFKDWATTETNGTVVTEEMRVRRAQEIAKALIDPARWHSHARPIHMQTLINDLNLKIENFGADNSLSAAIHSYQDLLTDFMQQTNQQALVHAPLSCV